MAETKMQKRFIRRGITKIWFLPAIADLKKVTLAEITAGKDVGCWMSEISGFTASAETVETPDLCSMTASKIPAGTTLEDSSITFYEDLEDDTIETTFTNGVEGFLVFAPKGDKAGRILEAWPVRVNGNPVHNYTTGTDPATVTVNFACTAEGVTGKYPAE